MENLFSMKNINKRFGKVQVLKNVQFTVNKGEIHALMGENGAGKSTLMNILSGALKKDSGTIEFEGKEIKEATPEIAEQLGIGFVHQELNLAESISVAENVFMNRLPCKNKILGIIDFKALYQQTQKILNILGAKFKPTDIVEHLSTANKQLVEIAKAISLNAKVIIFDEPTTSLSEQDVEVLFIVIRALKEKGISSVYISHRMKEIYELCDRITIMRDGKYISTNPVEELTNDEIIHKLVGRSLNNLYPKEEVSIGDIYLKVEGLSDKKGYLKNINFYARKGEVVGFAGLVGSGRTETMRMIFGADRSASGKISIEGREVKINSPVDAIKNGICLLTEDRKQQGLALTLSIKDNINISSLNKTLINNKKMSETSQHFVKTLRIKTNDDNNPVSSLSGGNQQKVVLAKWLNTENQIYIFDEPTKGIDVGAKSEIYGIINQLAKEGKTVLIVSSEIPELLGICDRIYVLSEGRVTRELKTDEATQEKIMAYATPQATI
ncbi:D-xylose ABC transporter ATP-binding protein [Enterococcus villorum]|uniref:D-xylose ABC transporter ATP-binding protein n=1 Tax=Enterococcus villorum TaxID=112904 RepID=A0A1V8YU83_9ENTE|nr:sugar ABC transporter ATP-binding protein [Enterococcus villorum]OQO71597.1 D-xylose ABC transporter ATP-binding protein [Enterococcus villorum]OQO76161.1 D-xylose ABC transporter ATP-binding protein [Enterococcus villorum]